MGGWIVSRIIDEKEPVSYKFTPKFVLKGGQSVTVSFTLKTTVNIPFASSYSLEIRL